jgi:signal transduction histidine kinase
MDGTPAPGRQREPIAHEKDRLQLLMQMRTHLESNITHELRTPIATIRGYTRMILDGRAGKLSSTQEDYLRAVMENVDRLVNLANWMSKVLQYRPEDLRLETLDLRELWFECADSMVGPISEKSIQLKQNIPNEPFWTICDRNKLEQVFKTLLANVMRRSSNGGEITVQLTRGREKEVMFKISDQGAEIPPEMRRTLERHYGAGLSPMCESDPSTLDLVGVYDNIALHGGRVFISYKAGEGSTLLFTLPAVGRESEENSRDEQAVHSGGR